MVGAVFYPLAPRERESSVRSFIPSPQGRGSEGEDISVRLAMIFFAVRARWQVERTREDAGKRLL